MTQERRPELQSDLDETINLFESRLNTTSSSSLGYTLTNSFPQNATTNDIRTVTYYDNYSLDHIYSYGDYAFIDDFPEEQSFAKSSKVKDLVTGGMIRVLEHDKWLRYVNYYDDRYRLIQSHNETQLGKDRISYLYDFLGNVMKSQTFHEDEETTKIRREYTYDKSNLMSISHQIEDGPVVEIASYVYNEVGDVIEKDQHIIEETAPVQRINYSYNIRGWLTHINDASLSDPEDLFGMELYYDYGFNNTWFNGNISGVKWKTWQDENTRAFGYNYDNTNRLMGADYISGEAFSWDKEPNLFDVGNLSYDYNGNILTAKRNGLITDYNDATYYGQIDDMAYSYNGNQLLAVEDLEKPAKDRNDFSNEKSLSKEYFFDRNGNMYKDENKNISNIVYNELNLPAIIEFADGKSIHYVYDATGLKLSGQLFEGTTPGKKTDYIGEFLYEDDVLTTIQHEEGRVVLGEGSYAYQYFLKDHLGNVRITYTTDPLVINGRATNEIANAETERAAFLNYDQVTRINSPLFDHTKEDSSHYAIRLSVIEGERIGLAKSFKVMPGDTIRAKSLQNTWIRIMCSGQPHIGTDA